MDAALLCAEHYGEGRVFIAGDAAHLVILTGGLGMNTGVATRSTSWKLAASLAGWGGTQLLASYDRERCPIGLRNVKASGAAMSGRLSWRAVITPISATIRPKAQRSVLEWRAVSTSSSARYEILGIEAGYRYVARP
jgi:2-polyprenyl-6-methoxyphenol hydroxylase-like FAD-dependent oxidoreductase